MIRLPLSPVRSRIRALVALYACHVGEDRLEIGKGMASAIVGYGLMRRVFA